MNESPRSPGPAEALRARSVVWPSGTYRQGELLDHFALHCRDELDDVAVLDEAPDALRLGWRRETMAVRLSPGPAEADRLPATEPIMLLVDALPDGFAEWFLDQPGLADRVAVYELPTARKMNIVRAVVPVYFEWFLREQYGVRPRPAPEFTEALLRRGVISTGMG